MNFHPTLKQYLKFNFFQPLCPFCNKNLKKDLKINKEILFLICNSCTNIELSGCKNQNYLINRFFIKFLTNNKIINATFNFEKQITLIRCYNKSKIFMDDAIIINAIPKLIPFSQEELLNKIKLYLILQ